MRISSFLPALFVVCILFPSSVFATGAWISLAEPSTATYYAISCRISACVAVGSSGSVAYSSSGTSWSTGTSGTIVSLRGVHYYDSGDVIAVGNSGKIITSSDGGATWAAQTSGTTRTLYDVYMSGSTGWAVGDTNTILKTSDGGSTWANVATMVMNARQVELMTSTTVWVTGKNGLVYVSTDSGSTWTSKTSAVGGTGVLGAMDFYGGTVGYIGGENRFLTMTTDGGVTWSPITLSDFDSTETITGVVATSSTQALVVGSNGHIATLSSGIATMQESTLASGTALYGVAEGTFYQFAASAGLIAAYDEDGPNAVTELRFTEGSYTNVTNPTLTWKATSDALGDVASYEVTLDREATWIDVGNTTSYTTSGLSGSVVAAVRAIDTAGNVGGLSHMTITVDTDSPDLGSLTPSSATEDTSVTFLLSPTDGTTAIDSCAIAVNGSPLGSMTDDGSGNFSYAYTFSIAGSYAVSVTCEDLATNESTITQSVTIASASETVSEDTSSSGGGSSTSESTSTTEEATDGTAETTSDVFATGDLIKLACHGGEAADAPCKAVYYYGADGKRHAFPNEKVYFTWYSDFDDVVIIEDDAMSDITLGKNVTYHPGSRMVKFVTVHTVYVVDSDGSLRPVASEAAATELYGDDWNTEIDDISDAFYGNYTRSSDAVNGAEDFDPVAAYNTVDSIDDIL